MWYLQEMENLIQRRPFPQMESLQDERMEVLYAMESLQVMLPHRETPTDLFMTPERTKMEFNLFPATEAFTQLKYAIMSGGGNYYQDDSRGLKEGADCIIDIEQFVNNEQIELRDDFISSRYIFESFINGALLDKTQYTLRYLRDHQEPEIESEAEGNISQVAESQIAETPISVSTPENERTDGENGQVSIAESQAQQTPTSVQSSEIEQTYDGKTRVPKAQPRAQEIPITVQTLGATADDGKKLVPNPEPQVQQFPTTEVAANDGSILMPNPDQRAPGSPVSAPTSAKKARLVETDDGEVPTTSRQVTETCNETTPNHDVNFEWKTFKFTFKDLELKKSDVNTKENAKENSKELPKENTNPTQDKITARVTLTKSRKDETSGSGFESEEEENPQPLQKSRECTKKNVLGSCSKQPPGKVSINLNDDEGARSVVYLTSEEESDDTNRNQDKSNTKGKDSHEGVKMTIRKPKRIRDELSSSSSSEDEPERKKQDPLDPTKRTWVPVTLTSQTRPSEQNSDITTRDNVRPPNELTGNERYNQKKQFYTKSEDIKMLKIIGASQWHSHVTGKSIYKEMANKETAFPTRSFESLSNRFRKTIFLNLRSYNLSEHELRLYNRGAEIKHKGANLPTTPYNPNWKSYKL